MEELKIFFKNFIQKDKLDRWLTLISAKSNKLYNNLHQLENQLNKDYCTLIEKNAFEFYQKFINDNKIESGYLFNLREEKGEYTDLKNIDENSIECLLILPEYNSAFYFHHEGWIWFCNRQK